MDSNLYINKCQKGVAWVNIIPENKIQNYTNDKDQHNKRTSTEEKIKLSLTAPIVSAWAYQLAISLHIGTEILY